MKQRLAAALLAQRVERGGGDPRRFPQPAMARLLGYSLRQYQRLEDPDDPNLPTWNNIESISEKLSLDAAEIFGEDEPVEAQLVTEQPTPGQVLARLDTLEQSVESLRQVVLAALEDRGGRQASG